MASVSVTGKALDVEEDTTLLVIDTFLNVKNNYSLVKVEFMRELLYTLDCTDVCNKVATECVLSYLIRLFELAEAVWDCW